MEAIGLVLGGIGLLVIVWGVRRYMERKRQDKGIKERDRIAGEK